MIVMLGCDVGTYRFRCVRRLFNVPPLPPSYRCRLNDGGYSVIFVLCGRIRRLIDTTDAPAGTSLHPASRKTHRRGDWGGCDSDASVLCGCICRWVGKSDAPAGTSLHSASRKHPASRKTHQRGQRHPGFTHLSLPRYTKEKRRNNDHPSFFRRFIKRA